MQMKKRSPRRGTVVKTRSDCVYSTIVRCHRAGGRLRIARGLGRICLVLGVVRRRPKSALGLLAFMFSWLIVTEMPNVSLDASGTRAFLIKSRVPLSA
ncbi:hypothetical protein PoMZ_07897 [Pyricularia oryzae]|uniref:Uncharacterized protein n=1 Tax=Pyricularia oryzae TaxID=318829 RepID=A0A4P7NGB7_PYROR|nr:hypothetical protein PoMZ_07897 [Pyricularia oryzae]